MFCGDDVHAVVGDLAGGTSRFGYAGEDLPKICINSNVGITQGSRGSRRHVVGDVALGSHIHDCNLENVMEKGKIKNWDIAESLWKEALVQRLQIEPSQTPIMVVEPSHASAEDRSAYVKFMFERLDAMCIYVVEKAVASAFAVGRPTSMVVDVGATGSSVAAVFEGTILKSSVKWSPAGGGKIDEKLFETLSAKLPGKSTLPPRFFGRSRSQKKKAAATSSQRRAAQFAVARDIKETFCAVPETPLNMDIASKVQTDSYELPDGTQITLGAERYSVPELLMCSSDEDCISSDATIPALFSSSLKATAVDVRKPLCSSIILAGGTTMLNGFSKRLGYEICETFPSQLRPRFVSQSSIERKSSAWAGGSVLASLGSFQQLWISRQEWMEEGDALVHRRCR